MRSIINNKKGLSDVVTTVLIILLVLAAVVIIWTFVQPALKKGSARVTADCITLVLKPVSCSTSASGSNMTVKWDSGDVKLVGIKTIYQTASGDKVDSFTTGLPMVLESKLFTSTAASATKATVAGVIQTESGEQITCSEVSPRIDCA